MRLIDADKFLVFGYNDVPDANFADGVSYVLEKIDEATTIEPAVIHEPTKSEFRRMAEQLGYEKVVRCKDCIFFGEDESTLTFCKITHCTCVDDDFCSRGERKENSLFEDIKTGLKQAIDMEKHG